VKNDFIVCLLKSLFKFIFSSLFWILNIIIYATVPLNGAVVNLSFVRRLALFEQHVTQVFVKD